MAEEYTGKVAWDTAESRYYAIPDEVEDKYVLADDCQTVNWIADNDDPEDLGGHFELVPESEDTYPVAKTEDVPEDDGGQ